MLGTDVPPTLSGPSKTLITFKPLVIRLLALNFLIFGVLTTNASAKKVHVEYGETLLAGGEADSEGNLHIVMLTPSIHEQEWTFDNGELAELITIGYEFTIFKDVTLTQSMKTITRALAKSSRNIHVISTKKLLTILEEQALGKYNSTPIKYNKTQNSFWWLSGYRSPTQSMTFKGRKDSYYRMHFTYSKANEGEHIKVEIDRDIDHDIDNPTN